MTTSVNSEVSLSTGELLSNRKRKRSNSKLLKYIHITKCGGTSIEDLSKEYGQFLWGKYDEELKDATSDIFVRDFSFWHIPPRFFIKGYYKSMIKKYDFFVTVRNPFTRVVSEYYCAWGGPQVKASNVHDFNVWIKNKLLSIQDLVFKRLNDKTAMFGHWIPQYIYITDSSGSQIVETANIIHLETLDDEFDSLMKRYNLPSDFTLRKKPHSLKSNKTFDVNDLNDENIQLIQNIYLNDFEMLGYDKNKQNLMPISSTITLVNTECS